MKNDRPFNILLADDDPDDIFFFSKALNEVSISTQLTTASNGERLMDLLKKVSAGSVDVIFLDLNMPRKTGRTCLLEIKSEDRLKHIPIVIYSTSYQADVANVLYEMGANYYLQKPDFSELPGRIEQVLTLVMNKHDRPSRDEFLLNGVAAI